LLPSGELRKFNMFSSMGNGYTFCLETILFSAMVMASMCLHGLGKLKALDSAIYGDDLVVPSVVVPTLLEILEYYGFKVNNEKTFFTGPFRESCGKDYYMGSDVTPVYYRARPKTPCDILKLHNSLYSWFAFHAVDGFDIVSETILDHMYFTPFGPVSEEIEAYAFCTSYKTISEDSRLFVKGFVKKEAATDDKWYDFVPPKGDGPKFKKRTCVTPDEFPYDQGAWVMCAALCEKSEDPGWLQTLKRKLKKSATSNGLRFTTGEEAIRFTKIPIVRPSSDSISILFKYDKGVPKHR
jgi:hypothetical protein